MRRNCFFTECVVFVCFVGTFGGNYHNRICDRVLPDNRVGRQDFLDKITTGGRFLVIYSIVVNPSIDYFKARRSFFENGVRVGYRFDDGACQEGTIFFDDNPDNDVIEIRKRGRCVRRDAYTVEGDPRFFQTRFYSQDLSRYFWRFQCVEAGTGLVASFPDSCGNATSYLELHIKDLRDPPTPNTELDLSDIPWGIIEQDLKDIAGVTFTDPSVEYKWLGEECPFSDLSNGTDISDARVP